MLKTKGKMVVTFDREKVGEFVNFHDKPCLMEITVDVPAVQKKLDSISDDQRRKLFALFNDIGNFIGESAENIKEQLKNEYCIEQEMIPFSLSDVSTETASDLINWIVEWALQMNIPLKESPMKYGDDERMLLAMIKNRVCVICGEQGADVHHREALGMGRNRNLVDDSNMAKIPLCRRHHSEAHTIGGETFAKKYHV